MHGFSHTHTHTRAYEHARLYRYTDTRAHTFVGLFTRVRSAAAGMNIYVYENCDVIDITQQIQELMEIIPHTSHIAHTTHKQKLYYAWLPRNDAIPQSMKSVECNFRFIFFQPFIVWRLHVCADLNHNNNKSSVRKTKIDSCACCLTQGSRKRSRIDSCVCFLVSWSVEY